MKNQGFQLIRPCLWEKAFCDVPGAVLILKRY